MPVVILPSTDKDSHAYHQYIIRHENRDELRAFLAERNILTQVHYPVPIHLQPAYRGKLGDTGSFPVSEMAAQEVLSLPLYPELNDAQIKTVVDAIADWCGRKKL